VAEWEKVDTQEFLRDVSKAESEAYRQDGMGCLYRRHPAYRGKVSA
jgi:hypothetical protein